MKIAFDRDWLLYTMKSDLRKVVRNVFNLYSPDLKLGNFRSTNLVWEILAAFTVEEESNLRIIYFK